MRRRFSVHVLLLLVVLLGPSCAEDEPSATLGENPSILEFEEGDLRFTYHVITGQESLFDLTTDPGCLDNLAPVRPEDLKRLRTSLQKRLGVDDLEDLRDAKQEEIDRLRSLGYL